MDIGLPFVVMLGNRGAVGMQSAHGCCICPVQSWNVFWAVGGEHAVIPCGADGDAVQGVLHHELKEFPAVRCAGICRITQHSGWRNGRHSPRPQGRQDVGQYADVSCHGSVQPYCVGPEVKHQ
jgi:hypothetical protein